MALIGRILTSWAEDSPITISLATLSSPRMLSGLCRLFGKILEELILFQKLPYYIT